MTALVGEAISKLCLAALTGSLGSLVPGVGSADALLRVLSSHHPHSRPNCLHQNFHCLTPANCETLVMFESVNRNWLFAMFNKYLGGPLFP